MEWKNGRFDAFKQLVRVFEQISDGSQYKEKVDSLLLIPWSHPMIVSEDCPEHFVL